MHPARAYVLGCLALVLLGPPGARADQTPVVAAPSEVDGAEGDSLTFTVTATDPDGDAITALGALDLPPRAVFDVNLAARSGTFRWKPSFTEAGVHDVVFFAGNDVQGLAYTSILVGNTDRPPVIVVAPLIEGVEGAPIDVYATATDPDGDTFISFVAEGLPAGFEFTTNDRLNTCHVYGTPESGLAGLHAVTLIAVTRPLLDGPGADSAAVWLSIAPGHFPARIYTLGGEKTIRLAVADHECIEIEAVSGAFDPRRVDPSQVQMTWGGAGFSIAADGADVSQADRDGNGFPDVTVCFAKDRLRQLFRNFPSDRSKIRATVTGTLTGGTTFNGAVDLEVLTLGGPVFLTPNPSRGSPILSFYTTQVGWARLEIFDSRGRLVRTLLDEPYWRPGFHDVPLNASRSLPAGVYYYRLNTTDGAHKGKVVLLK